MRSCFAGRHCAQGLVVTASMTGMRRTLDLLVSAINTHSLLGANSL